MTRHLIKMLTTLARLILIGGVFGAGAALVQRGDFPTWIDVLAYAVTLPLSFATYGAASSTDFGRKYLYDLFGWGRRA